MFKIKPPFWTYQRKELVAQLARGMDVVPDFSVGPICGSSRSAYLHLLERYDRLTCKKHTGLIFGFVGSTRHPFLYTQHELEIVLTEAGKPFGTSFAGDTRTRLQLQVPDDVLVLPVDFYKFTDLLFFMEDGDAADIESAKEFLFRPNSRRWGWELMCGHIPSIKPEWVVTAL